MTTKPYTIVTACKKEYEFNPTGKPGGERVSCTVTAKGGGEYSYTLSKSEYGAVCADIAERGEATLPGSNR